ncbi:SH3 domain-containing protein [Streptomyces hirsutus]|uniref:SH3 domain-containing protein n=1 Tax=Streptomyces hirsutus TaxID=35620 RepID=UPI0006E2ADAE|nr:SH3 domain-containing protein [Streptomyces hirsutus]
MPKFKRTRRLLCAAVAGTALALLPVSASGAQVMSPDADTGTRQVLSRGGYFLGDGVNIRSRPVDGTVLGQGYFRETFTAYCWSSDGYWIRLTAHRGNVTGWVSVNYVFYTDSGPMGYC